MRGHSCGRQDMTAGDIPTIPKLACVRKEVRYSVNCSGTISRDSPVTSASFHTGACLLAFVNSVDNLYVPPVFQKSTKHHALTAVAQAGIQLPGSNDIPRREAPGVRIALPAVFARRPPGHLGRVRSR